MKRTVLLDTHVFIEAIAAPERLPVALRDALRDPDVALLVSAVTAWEMAVKHALGLLRVDEVLVRRFHMHVAGLGASELPLTAEHMLAAAALPPHHSDPFDRMLVAQARTERVPLATTDARVLRYEVASLP
ncbi:type II toxin-antitoxin system VapC family toxin [soil metagenome]|nr:type II toxin-antitoxin system VapC family toxin [Trueperaceae bacterium]